MAENISRDMSVLSGQTEQLSEEVQTINISVHDITNAVSDSANQVVAVSSASTEIVDNMSRLTDTAMLKMVK